MRTIVILAFLRLVSGDSHPVKDISDKDNLRPKRIVGGSIAKIRDHPYIAFLESDDHIFCTASILTVGHVLTAAHCVVDSSVEGMFVGVGADEHNPGWTYPVDKLTIHPNYVGRLPGKSPDFRNDVAVARVRKPIMFGETVKPVCLYDGKSRVETGDIATVVGYGVTATDDDTSKILRKVDISVQSKKTCLFLYYSESEDSLKGTICAGAPGKLSCLGDSGGPLMVKGRQAGIISWSINCMKATLPGFSTDVAMYRDWIEDAVRQLGGPPTLPTCPEHH